MRIIRQWVLLLSAALLLTLSAGAAEQATVFSDVPERHWAAESIRSCAQLGLLQGRNDGSFGMGQEMSRGAYLTALCRVMGWTLLTPEQGSFEDNRDTARWYFGAVETAAAHGVLDGVGTLCRAEEGITRAEMAAMTVRALGYAALSGLLTEQCPFTDCTANGGYITLACRMGLVKGVNRYTFSPAAVALREQAAAVLLRTYEAQHRSTVLCTETPAEGVPVVSGIEDMTNGIPLLPRAPLEMICAAAKSGTETLALNAVPVSQHITADGSMGEVQPISQFWLDSLLSDGRTKLFRSLRYGSSYLLHEGSDGTVTVAWYESQEDIAAKLALCRLLGVKSVYVIRQQ